MPELPEVETTLRGIEPVVSGRTIEAITVRQPSLRQMIPDQVQAACGQKIIRAWRRGKYLLLDVETGGLMIHLGMSGSLRICHPGDPIRKHDHFDLVTDEERCVRYNDPRRFGVFRLGLPNADTISNRLLVEPTQQALFNMPLAARDTRRQGLFRSQIRPFKPPLRSAAARPSTPFWVMVPRGHARRIVMARVFRPG